ncbi:MAG: hypothetical protein OEY79_05030 [Anaplasmataceae bacterium]|nr:hypothetical protein [Anaplasmataceae bacterium]
MPKTQQQPWFKRTKDYVLNKVKVGFNTATSFFNRITGLKFEHFLGYETTTKLDKTNKKYVINHSDSEDAEYINIRITEVQEESHKDINKKYLHFLSKKDYDDIKNKTLSKETNSDRNNLFYIDKNSRKIPLYKCSVIATITENDTIYTPFVRIDADNKATLVYVDGNNRISNLSISEDSSEKVTRINENLEVSIPVILNPNSNILSKFLNIVFFGFGVKVPRVILMIVPMVLSKVGRLSLSLSNWLLVKEQNTTRECDKQSNSTRLRAKLYCTKGFRCFFGGIGIFFDTIAVTLRGIVAITFNSLQCAFAHILYPIRSDDDRRASIKLVQSAYIGLKHGLQSVRTMATQLAGSKTMESAALSEPPLPSEKKDSGIKMYTATPTNAMSNKEHNMQPTSSNSKEEEISSRNPQSAPPSPKNTPDIPRGDTGIFDKNNNRKR